MRLSPAEADAIREETRQADPAAEVYLFGSRADDSARGGDIDLFMISSRLGFRETLHLKAAILDRIGWQQLDLVIRPPERLEDPLASIALETGVRL